MVEPAAEVLSELQDQIWRLNYSNPMSIENLLNHPEEQLVTFCPTEEEIIAGLKTPTIDKDVNQEG